LKLALSNFSFVKNIISKFWIFFWSNLIFAWSLFANCWSSNAFFFLKFWQIMLKASDSRRGMHEVRIFIKNEYLLAKMNHPSVVKMFVLLMVKPNDGFYSWNILHSSKYVWGFFRPNKNIRLLMNKLEIKQTLFQILCRFVYCCFAHDDLPAIDIDIVY